MPECGNIQIVNDKLTQRGMSSSLVFNGHRAVDGFSRSFDTPSITTPDNDTMHSHKRRLSIVMGVAGTIY